MPDTIKDLEAELSRYEALHKAGRLRMPQGQLPTAQDATFAAMSVLRVARSAKDRDTYERRLRGLVLTLRAFNPD